MSGEEIHLGREIAEIEEHNNRWVEEFQSYYEDENDSGHPPHEKMKRRAESFIRRGMEEISGDQFFRMGSATPHEIHLILVSLGAETLLKAVILKHDWDFFKQESSFSSNRSIGLDDCCEWVSDDLEDELGVQERLRVRQVLKIIRLHRNNSVHMGYMKATYTRHTREIYRVLAFLLDRYFESSDIMESLAHQVRQSYENKPKWGIDYPDVDLGIVCNYND